MKANSELLAIQRIERHLETLADDAAKARVLTYLADKYRGVMPNGREKCNQIPVMLPGMEK